MSNSSIIKKEGWLLKQGHVNTEMKRRWIELQKTGKLVYYEEVDSSLRQRGTVNLERFTLDEHGSLGFKIITPEDKRGVFIFQASTAEEKNSWVEALLEISNKSPVEMKSGFLWKMGDINKAWKRRWCILNPSELKYYKKDTDPKPAGVVKLANYNAVARASLAEVDRTFSLKIYNSDAPKQRVFYFSSDTEVDIENWFQVIRTCIEGVEIKVDVELFKNDPIQTITCTYKPTLTVQQFLSCICEKTEPKVNPEHYQLLQGGTFQPCDPAVRMDFFGPICFKVVARKGHAKRKAPPPGIKRIVEEALAEQRTQDDYDDY